MSVLTAVQLGMGVAQTLSGLVNQGKANRKINQLMSQRKSYKTPEEIFKIAQATQQNAQTGLGAETLSYLTSNNDRNLSTTVGASSLLGGDPNDFGALLDRAMQQTMAIGGQNQAMQMENFSKYLGALNTVADNRTAEWQSQENILKDKLQAASAESADAAKNIQSGINTGLGALSANEQMKLYNTQNDNTKALLDYLSNQKKVYPTLERIPTQRSTTNSMTIIPRNP
jgi:hypothetical protein